MTTANQIGAELHLPLFKVGDDIAHCLKGRKRQPDAALLAYAGQLRAAAEQVERLAGGIAGQKVQVEADTHFVGVYGPEDVLRPLIQAEVLSERLDIDDGDEEE